eukprot:CAMPEP_0197178368 /NCGR_PEP_ID=MMETSP1423-20130617/3664_1 /TAXON_ID=476441 /ORGANISM="Pseudo-nitzschia heimii, Strain UNC1101" /LENGTH=389 /DNA_ID=CAMNT_0042628085 /DNA_START=189 /DNA_END=1358 /DNA_ORIENTATION=-
MTAGSDNEKDAAADGARESSERQERTENENSDDEVEEEQQREDLVWYFSYGSNMNPEVFEKKRGIRCLDHRVCTAPGYVLSYSESLLPWCEPAFCTCLRRSDDLPCCRDKPDIHGVAFLITWEQYEHVLLTEGGWGYQEHRYDPLWSVGCYGEEEIECVEIEPETTTESEKTEASEAVTATSSADAGRLRPLRRFKAMTLTGLLSDLQLHDANCSKRYYDIVNEGAKSSGLPASYRDYLRERHPAYEMSPCWRAKLAMILYCTVAFPCVFFECFPAQLCMGRNERKLKAKEAAAAAAAEETTTTTKDPATTTGDARTARTRRRFETVARPPWILLKLCYLYKCVVLERVMLPLLTDLCKLPSGYRNRPRSCSAAEKTTTVDDAAAETGQ